MTSSDDEDPADRPPPESAWALRRFARFLREFQTDVRDGRPRDEPLTGAELTALEEHIERAISSMAQTEPEYKMLVTLGATFNFVGYRESADKSGIDVDSAQSADVATLLRLSGKIAAALEDLARVSDQTGDSPRMASMEQSPRVVARIPWHSRPLQ